MGWRHVHAPGRGTSAGRRPAGAPRAAKLRLSIRSTYRMPCSRIVQQDWRSSHGSSAPSRRRPSQLKHGRPRTNPPPRLQVVALVLQDAGLPAVRAQAQRRAVHAEALALHRRVALNQGLRVGGKGVRAWKRVDRGCMGERAGTVITSCTAACAAQRMPSTHPPARARAGRPRPSAAPPGIPAR